MEPEGEEPQPSGDTSVYRLAGLDRIGIWGEGHSDDQRAKDEGSKGGVKENHQNLIWNDIKRNGER